MKKQTAPAKVFRPLEKIAHDLGLLESDVEKMLGSDAVEVRYDYLRRPCISEEYIGKLSRSPLYSAAKSRSLESDRLHKGKETTERRQLLKNERKSLISKYQSYVQSLEDLHSGCLARVNLHDNESAVTAAYLLFSKAISCLRLGCLSLEHGHWYAGSILREIDETVDLAQYFLLSKHTADGASNLRRWFRENRAPKHSLCRKVIADYFVDALGTEATGHHALMNDLYQDKSKWTHPTYSSIREITEFEADEDPKIIALTYGECNFEYKLLELTDFFRSSVWTTFQIFCSCMFEALPLTREESDSCAAFDRVFSNWPKSNLI